MPAMTLIGAPSIGPEKAIQIDTLKFRNWIAVEREAQAAERQIERAIALVERGRLLQVPDELACAAREKRHVANILFYTAMEELRVATESLQCVLSKKESGN